MHGVLLVDDHELLRSRLREAIERNPRWHVVGEASDGADGVRQAHALAPDLILLDMSLPRMSGLEAARQILARDPSAKILFLTQHNSADIAEAALATGARGYMLKTEIHRLLFVMEAVVNGGRYLSPELRGGVVLAGRSAAARATCRHEIGFYSDEQWLVDDYVRTAEAALCDGSAFVLLATEEYRDVRLQQGLRARGVALDDAIRGGRYRCVRVDTLLSTFAGNGSFDEAGFRAAALGVIGEAARASDGDRPCVSICGDGACHLWSSGRADTAIRVEQVWDQLAHTARVDSLCGYTVDVTSLDDEAYETFRRLCAHHSNVHIC